MPRIAKAYITLIIASGATVGLVAAGSWSSSNLRQFSIFMGLVVIASTLKMRIPGIEGTMSPNFVFLILGMTALSFSEVMAITLAAALVQSLWAARQARLVQITFSAAALLLSVAAARQASFLLFGPHAANSPVALVILAGSLYLSLNTAFVSTVIGLADGKPLGQVGRICLESVVPYFMAGIVFAGLVSGAFSRPTTWSGAITLLPIVVVGYLYSQIRTAVVAPARTRPASIEDDELVEVGSHRPRR
jgi:hypothetical protein